MKCKWIFALLGLKKSKIFKSMKLFSVFMFVFVLGTTGSSFSQQQVVSLDMHQCDVGTLFREIRKQTGLRFVYNEEHVVKMERFDVVAKGKTVKEILDDIFSGTTLKWYCEDDVIFIVRQAPVKETRDSTFLVKGTVKDVNGEPLPGVTILIKGTTIGVATDADGKFAFNVPRIDSLVLQVSFIGYQTETVRLKKSNEELNIWLKPTVLEMDEVIVTGIFERKKESFTGSATTYKGDRLKMISNQNVIQGLRSLDPAFSVMENNSFGSDPNRLPEIEIRGTTSFVGLKDEFGVNPNQPLFILDGFETDLRTVMALDMSRVESLTILKDAASTAIYGARAANGVVVIETKRPVMGKLQVAYTGDFSIQMPDLSGYNMMNAAEKLEFERLSGAYRADDVSRNDRLEQYYNERLAEVRRGVNTYWMKEPLRTGFSHAHSLNLSGGDQFVRYSLGIQYKNTQGVMKGSYKRDLSANFDLSYRYEKWLFRNNLSLFNDEGRDSPYESFRNFVEANPYFRRYNEDGVAEKYLTTPGLGQGETIYGDEENIANPLYNAKLNNRVASRNFNLRNNFSIEYSLLPTLKLRGRFGVQRVDGKEDSFTPARHTMFDGEPDPNKRGSYSASFTNGMIYDGDATVTYGQLLNDVHQLNVVIGWSINVKKSDTEGYEVIGFPSSVMEHPLFARGYPEGGKPTGDETHTKAVGVYSQVGYVYDDRYLFDFSFRNDGASQFGSNKKFVNSWSVGIAWNLHNEGFMRNCSWMNLLKLRASIGTPGNQNFSSFQTLSIYNYNTASSMRNRFEYMGAYLESKGNANLKWQQTLDRNIGVDLSFFNDRLMLSADAWNRKTENLVAFIGTPSSTGFKGYLANIGDLKSVGTTLNLSGILIKRPNDGFRWHMNFTLRSNKDTYKNIGKSLDYLNQENIDENDKQAAREMTSKSLVRYVEGGSVTSMWAVKSLGIDPGTGKELFLKKNGEITFDHDFDDEVKVGDSREKATGIIGTTFYYKRWSLNMNFRYSLRADKFNAALFNKVENISATGVKSNQDKRALYDRWQNPGDKAKFRAISMVDQTKMSSRFIQNESYISAESFRLGYETFDAPWMKILGLSRVMVSLYMNDLFRLSNIKIERGIDYPFARLMSLSISASF